MLSLIFTTYFPPPEFQSRLRALSNCCDFIIVVDNTPGGYSFDLAGNQYHILSNGKNKGLAGALNLGLQKSISLQSSFVALFDQDSDVTSTLINALYASIKNAQEKFGYKVCLGPNHVDDVKDRNLDLKPFEVTNSELESVTALPTSGMIFGLQSFTEDDLFSEQFFLDFVDFEWCWRLGKKKWHIYRISNLFLFHRLGLGEYNMLGFKFYKPSPYRQYYQVRDTLNIFVMPHAPIYARFRLLSVVPFKILVYPFIFGNGFERVKWSMLGIKDFFLRIGGIGAGRKKLA